MIFISESELERIILDDCEYADITTPLMSVNSFATLELISKKDAVCSNLDLAKRICKKFECEFKSSKKNGDFVVANEKIGEVEGEFNAIHNVYKCVQIMLEYSFKISTLSKKLLDLAKSQNKNCEVLVTRKSFPVAKKICLKSALEGGAKIHRLGVFDNVLFFKTHLCAFKTLDEFCKQIPSYKAKMCEKKIMVECEKPHEAELLMCAGADAILCDKFGLDELGAVIELRNDKFKDTIILAAGGINETNAKQIAATGVNAIVTSSVFCGGMSDISAVMNVKR